MRISQMMNLRTFIQSCRSSRIMLIFFGHEIALYLQVAIEIKILHHKTSPAVTEFSSSDKDSYPVKHSENKLQQLAIHQNCHS